VTKETCQRCLDSMRFSLRPWLKLLEMYSEEGDLQRLLQAAIRVAAYQYADPSQINNQWNSPAVHALSSTRSPLHPQAHQGLNRLPFVTPRKERTDAGTGVYGGEQRGFGLVISCYSRSLRPASNTPARIRPVSPRVLATRGHQAMTESQRRNAYSSSSGP
jgi:hypothetical protein